MLHFIPPENIKSAPVYFRAYKSMTLVENELSTSAKFIGVFFLVYSFSTIYVTKFSSILYQNLASLPNRRVCISRLAGFFITAFSCAIRGKDKKIFFAVIPRRLFSQHFKYKLYYTPTLIECISKTIISPNHPNAYHLLQDIGNLYLFNAFIFSFPVLKIKNLSGSFRQSYGLQGSSNHEISGVQDRPD